MDDSVQFLKMVRRPEVIGVEECDPIARCFHDPTVSGGARAGVWLTDKSDIGERRAGAMTAISGAIIYDDYFGRGVCLRKDACQRGAEVCSLVVQRDDYRDADFDGWPLPLGPLLLVSDKSVEAGSRPSGYRGLRAWPCRNTLETTTVPAPSACGHDRSRMSTPLSSPLTSVFATLMRILSAITSSFPAVPPFGRLSYVIAQQFRSHKLPSITTSVLGSKMFLDPSQMVENALLFSPQWWDVHERRFLARNLTRGDHFVDVGANVGGYALWAARLVGPHGHVTAIEADPTNASLLRHNAEINDYTHIAVVAAGVSDCNEELDLLLNTSENRGGHSFLPRTYQPLAEHAVRVRCLPLSELLSHPASVMKLDIEGFEARVLREYFKSTPPDKRPRAILLEDNARHRDGDPVKVCIDAGYSIAGRWSHNVGLTISPEANQYE